MAEKVKDKTVLAEVVLRKRNTRTFDEKQTSRLILHQASMNLLTCVKKTPLHVCTPD